MMFLFQLSMVSSDQELLERFMFHHLRPCLLDPGNEMYMSEAPVSRIVFTFQQPLRGHETCMSGGAAGSEPRKRKETQPPDGFKTPKIPLFHLLLYFATWIFPNVNKYNGPISASYLVI